MQLALRRLQLHSWITSEVQPVLGRLAVMLRGLQVGSCRKRSRCSWCGACCRWFRGSAGGQLHEAATLQLVLHRLQVAPSKMKVAFVAMALCRVWQPCSLWCRGSAGGQLHAW